MAGESVLKYLTHVTKSGLSYLDCLFTTLARLILTLLTRVLSCRSRSQPKCNQCTPRGLVCAPSHVRHQFMMRTTVYKRLPFYSCLASYTRSAASEAKPQVSVAAAAAAAAAYWRRDGDVTTTINRVLFDSRLRPHSAHSTHAKRCLQEWPICTIIKPPPHVVV